MAENSKAKPVQVKPEVEVKTKKQLLAEMKVAVDSGNFKAVSKISAEIAKLVAAEEKAEREAKQAAAAELSIKVKAQIDAVVKKLIDSKALDVCDGVWYSYDFGEKLSTCRLLKSQPKAKGGGWRSGVGKRFAISTAELLAKHGDEIANSETGETFKQAYEKDTSGNARYRVRMKLLKAEGLT